MGCVVSVGELHVEADLLDALSRAGRVEFSGARLGGAKVRSSGRVAGEVAGGLVGSPMTLEEWWAERDGEDDV
mgnify:CR=1 FL=1|jgi:outer membrane lipoprotein SlyB|tara:strand:- start:5666 stop:5884 length:219 start_codon:yes stop_codon:yes gene_type:complete